MFIAISILLVLACAIPAGAKLAGAPAVRESAAHFAIPWNRYRLISVPELAAAAGVLAGLWLHPLGVAAACGMAVLLVAALVAHRRAGDDVKTMAPALAATLITAAYLIIALTG
ncbi:MAG TPA: DoxX family protein [Streptosporangiaceae bacterium]